MTLHQTQLVAFAAGSVIHGTQAVLVWKLWGHNTGANRGEAKEGFAICFLAFLWQFSNFCLVMASSLGYGDASAAVQIGFVTQSVTLMAFPVLFSYMVPECRVESRIARYLTFIARGLRYPLWFFATGSACSLILYQAGVPVPFNVGWPLGATLNIMLFYFIVFLVLGILNDRRSRASGSLSALRANRAILVASLLGVSTFVIMLWLPERAGRTEWMALAAQMTSVPFTIAMAYRLYQFPFMDAFLREALTGIALLIGFCIAISAGPSAASFYPLWTATAAFAVAYARQPLSRWVDRKLLGYAELAEDQEERIGNSIRGLAQLSEFGPRVAEILVNELEADWVDVGPEPKSEAVAEFRIPGSTPMWLSLGPRKGARSYMSRQLRVVRRAVLELATQQERLQREDVERRQLVQHHELREITARAQMRALQAQINPHFLFNTLNVLANLIHSNPAKAEHVTEDLAEIFRYALESTRLERVRLEDELNFLESYLEIEKARFGNRLTYSFDVDESLRSLRIPPMILQPLVENAIKHGIGPKIEGGEVRLIARADADRMMICIEDTGAGLGHKGRGGTGIGLPNVRERLAHVYGEAAVLRLEEMSPAGTRVVLVLPMRSEVHA